MLNGDRFKLLTNGFVVLKLFWKYWVVIGGMTATACAVEPTPGEVLFAVRLQPLFAEKCLACHGDKPDAIESEFDMRSRASLLRGGSSFGEAVLIPGSAEDSYLHVLTRRVEPDYEMPPKEADRLTDQQNQWIEEWINAGAPWPSDERVLEIREQHAEGVRVATSGGLSDAWSNRRYQRENLWAYQPLRDVRPQSSGHPIDALINTRLDSLGLAPAPLADARTLIRRATFDLTGLPPTPAEVAAFEVATETDPEQAWTQLIDRLLDSVHYGEQWGRHWLDVVRYADSAGFANDFDRPNAWRYRDYVIRSFNQDKPYHEFLKQQIAGDEIGQRQDSEQLIATGFLRMGPWEHTSMSVAKVTRQQFLDDVTDSVGQVFLAHALQCARCHDHKFDPVPTRDYYAMQAVFATTQFADVVAAWLPAENRNGMEEDRRYHEMRLTANEQVLSDLKRKMARYQAEWFAERNLPWKTRAEAKQAGASPEQIPVGSLFREADEFGRHRLAGKWAVRFRWELDRYRPIAMSVYNGKTRTLKGAKRIVMPDDPMQEGVLEATAILAGGDPFSPAETVVAGVLSAVATDETVVPEAPQGRRLALANWMVNEAQHLTSRVMVNRIWQHHFGLAIAGNPNNFGATGKKPTHPELLDWLAARFIEEGWSVKAMHRWMMTSKVYRRASVYPDLAKLNEIDPDHLSYAVFRPRRLTAEELRDAMLAVSGELNREVGGIPARPDINLEAALQPRMIMGTFAPSYVPNPRPKQRNRRSVYAHKTRGQRDPFLEVFNQPGSEKSCELRDTSNVTPQVFTLFNSWETHDRSLAFALRVLDECKGGSRRLCVQRAFELAFSRVPEEREIEATLEHWRRMEQRQEQITWQPRSYPTEVVRQANEENTGEFFTFRESLFEYRDYLPDVQPHEVDAATRGFADICLALINANEFMFVD